ncbi:MAG: Gfo/Idh/MocA family oxidoreductase [Chloroflexi bacterium]|nr:Gfo/Idh/MocA family oxidoreductase [Chloroflexota bacterium]
MSKVRVGFIGAGRISTVHAMAYEDNPTGELVAVADRDRELAKHQAERWGAASSYGDYREMLASPEIDAVEILLPHNLHLQVTREALEAGKHVSLQKPMCLDMDEARQIIEAADSASTTFRMVENYRTYEPYMRAKEMLEAGEIGDPIGMRVKTVHGAGRGGWEIPASAMVWRADASQAGGANSLHDYGAHITSIIPFFLGDVEKVHAMADLSAGADRFTGSRSVITWKQAGAEVFGTWDMTDPDRFIIDTKYYPVDEWVEITGTRGILWLTRCTARMVDMPPLVMFRDGQTHGYSDLETDWGDSFRRAGHEFTDGIANGTQPQLDAREAAHTLAISLAAARSAVEHREVAISEL